VADLLPGTQATKFQTVEDLRSAVRSIIIELAPKAKGEPAGTARLVDDLGYHSLALLELAFALEDEFELQPIDEPTARRITTIDDVLNHVTAEYRAAGRIE
jgi:acyl carrier protein